MQLLSRVTHAPVVIERMLRDNILVTHYLRPSHVGSIIIPESYSEDIGNTLWEVLLSTPAAEAAVGCALPTGCILTTLRRWPEDSNLCTPDGRNVFVLSIAAAGVRSITVYAADEEL